MSVSFLVFLLAVSMLNGCGKSNSIAPVDVKTFKENLEERTTEESIYICDEDGNRLDNQMLKSGQQCWVGGSFQYSGNKDYLSVITVKMSRLNRDDKWVTHSAKTGEYFFKENSDWVTFLSDTSAPTQTGEFTLYASSLGTKFVESKVTVVK